jgi:hypothetical protein
MLFRRMVAWCMDPSAEMMMRRGGLEPVPPCAGMKTRPIRRPRWRDGVAYDDDSQVSGLFLFSLRALPAVDVAVWAIRHFLFLFRPSCASWRKSQPDLLCMYACDRKRVASIYRTHPSRFVSILHCAPLQLVVSSRIFAWQNDEQPRPQFPSKGQEYTVLGAVVYGRGATFRTLPIDL